MGLFDFVFLRNPDSRESARNKSPAATFHVAGVPLANGLLPEAAYKSAVDALLTQPTGRRGRQDQPPCPKYPVEACSRYNGQLVAGVTFHPIVAAVHLAFNDHRPLALSPDAIWLMIAQGFANHVNANSEQLRRRFVRHAGKLVINVRRDDFRKGSPENPWPEVFSEFSAAIRSHIGATTHDLLVPRFSTTGPVEKAASEIVLLDAMQSYFSYEFHTICGIPTITLEGTAADWADIVERVRQIAQFDLEWWTKPLVPVLKQFVAAAQGSVDRTFWQTMYKLGGGSGGPYTSGWITVFFPYLKDSETGLPTTRNVWLESSGKVLQGLLYPPRGSDPHAFGHGPTTEQFPSGLAKAPFVWKYLLDSYEMEFLGGFVGVRQDAETGCLSPEIGWAIREALPVVYLTWAALIDTYGKPVWAHCLTRSELQLALRERRLFSQFSRYSRTVMDEEVIRDCGNENVLVFPRPLPAELYVSGGRDVSFRLDQEVLDQNTPAKESELRANDQLLQAASSGQMAEVESALADGADINVRRQVSRYQVWWGWINSEGALDLAVLSGNKDTVELLLNRGVSRANPDGTYAWMCAACNGRQDLAEHLQREGVVVKLQTWQRQRLARIKAEAGESKQGN